MAIGPGKYDGAAIEALRSTGSLGIVLMVLEGDKGSGFSVVTRGADIAAKLPALLREMADGIEADMKPKG